MGGRDARASPGQGRASTSGRKAVFVWPDGPGELGRALYYRRRHTRRDLEERGVLNLRFCLKVSASSRICAEECRRTDSTAVKWVCMNYGRLIAARRGRVGKRHQVLHTTPPPPALPGGLAPPSNPRAITVMRLPRRGVPAVHLQVTGEHGVQPRRASAVCGRSIRSGALSGFWRVRAPSCALARWRDNAALPVATENCVLTTVCVTIEHVPLPAMCSTSAPSRVSASRAAPSA